jgi:hypothetical protein
MMKVESKEGNGEPARRSVVVKSNEPRVDEMLMEPGTYEVSKDSEFVIEIYLKPISGGKRWQIVTGPGKEVIKESVRMRMWFYDEMVDLKKRATSFDAAKRMHVVDHDALNRFKAQKFFLDWTFQNSNKRIILHKQNGVMTDESWAMFTRLQPNIIRHIFDKMNEIYEYNG